jgi:hypothetical protein
MRTFGNKKYSRRNGTVSKMLEGYEERITSGHLP